MEVTYDDDNIPTREWAIDVYVEKKLDPLDIAEAFTGKRFISTTYALLRYRNVRTRHKGWTELWSVIPPKQELERLYLEENKTTEELITIFKLEAEHELYGWLYLYGLVNRKTAKWDHDEIVDLFMNKGLTTTQIVEKTGIPYGSLMSVFRAEGVKVKDSPVRLDYEKIKMYYEVLGLSIKQIAKLTGANSVSVSDYLTKHGFREKQKRSTPLKSQGIDESTLRHLHYECKLNLHEIAKKLSVDISTISKACKRMGISVRPPSGRPKKQ